MTSRAVATFSAKGLDNPSKRGTDVGIATTLKKKLGDNTLTFQFSDASLKDFKSGQGVVVTAERKIGDGVKGEVKYDAGRKAAQGALTIDRKINGSDLSLKAIYQHKGDVFILEESWKFDKRNKLSGTYNFKNEAATFTYTYTQGAWTAEGKYDFAKDAPTLSVRRKQGKHTLQAVYGLKDEAATLSWEAKPFKLAVKSKAGRGGVSGVSASLQATKEFEF